MIRDDKRIRIIIGHYGSGKSEFAMNYVTKLRNEVEGKVALSDLDVVNVYFRTREKKDLLNSLDILPIYSSIDAPTLDLPAISPQIMAPITDSSYSYVMDVGGDNVGARVVGRFHELIEKADYDMFCVVNANREYTQSVEDVIGHIRAIEKSSGLKVTGLVNNTHLVRSTTVDDVLKGQKLVEQVSRQYNIPVKYIVCLEELVPQLPEDLEGEIFPIKLYMREAWM